jgi:hypothetical protein
VFALPDTRTANTAKNTVSPLIDIILGALMLMIAFWVGTGRDRRLRAWTERRHEKSKDKPPARWKREPSKGSVRDTFIVGALLSFPGASYIAGMDRLSKQKTGVVGTVLAVLAFNAIMLVLLELPLIGCATRPQSTAATVQRFRDWLSSHRGRIAVIGAAVIGAVLIGRGLLDI